jgi:hypothetical protein
MGNVHWRTSKKRLCGLNLEILYARLQNSFARNFPRDAQLQKFSSTNGISCWPKNLPMKGSLQRYSTFKRNQHYQNGVDAMRFGTLFNNVTKKDRVKTRVRNRLAS